jgi:hypothetical protein
MKRDLDHIDASLKMFDPRAQPRLIKPVRPYHPRNRIFERKELSVRVITALREAPDGSTTTNAIVERIMADKDLKPVAGPTIRKITTIALRALGKKGIVTKIDGETEGLWAVIP